MAWTETNAMEERMRFVLAYGEGEGRMSELCRLFGVSRPTGYKWARRFAAAGVEGLADRSPRPRHCPHAVDPEREGAILALRDAHSDWGPITLRERLEDLHPGARWPSASTIGEILKRRGRIARRRRRCRATPSLGGLPPSQRPNAVWTADFKGWFRLGNGKRCAPLTVMDHFSRYVLCCRALTGPTGHAQVRPLLEAVFRRYGLPEAIRTDNGPPFASAGLGGLSRLSVWWIQLGIRPERIEPGKPQQNGRHERMHRTLKERTVSPAAYSQTGQQRRFDLFEREFNEERPHAALDGATPGSFYAASPRPYPCSLRDLSDYPHGWVKRHVRSSGCMGWNGRDVGVTQALAGQIVGLQPTDDGRWRVHFGPWPLGIFEERTGRIDPEKPR